MKYLIDYMEKAQSELWAENGAFFAFSTEQFKKQSKENVKYVFLNFGLYCPAENIKKVLSEMDKIYTEAIKQDVLENGAENIIEREYFNHECQITHSIDDLLSSIEGYKKMFPDLFTEEKIRLVVENCFNEAIKNNWF